MERTSRSSPFLLAKKMARLSILIFCFSLISFSSLAQVRPDAIPSKLMDKSIRAVLGTRQSPEWKAIAVPDSIRRSLEGQLKIKGQVPDTLHIGIIQRDGSKNYIIPDIAPSRSEKFSYVLYIDSSPKIVGVDVLQYRENYGNEIDYPFFRKQFHGKQQPDKIIFGRTIQNISGATISARSITYSVHDLMLMLNQITLP